PGDSLTSLNISGNSICDINSVVMSFQSYFTNLTTLTASNQSTCPCSESGTDVSFFAHKTCRQRSDGDYQVECWHGYYLDKNTNTCIKACTSGYSVNPSDITGETCAEDLVVEDDNVIRCQVCERKEDVVAIYDSVSSSVLCASPCLSGWYGEDCSSECPIVGGEVCSGHGSCNTTDHACECDTWYDDASCSTLVPVYFPECDRTFTIDDHLECNEVYPGRYAAECEDGYYYDQGEYSCVEDTDGECPSDMNDHQMCVKTSGDIITSDCRSAWYGDDCDQLYQIHIPDPLFRGKVCDDIDNSDPLCDVSEFEMAGIIGFFNSYYSNITSFEGAQYLINIYSFYGRDTDVTSVYPISFLEQLSLLAFFQKSTTYNGNIYDLNSLFTLNRLYELCIYGNEQIYDISVSFRNVGLSGMHIAYTDYSAFISLCRSEDDTNYWTFITTVFPIHNSASYYKDKFYIPNSCALNNEDDYVCDSETYPTQCPSIVLNEVYNSMDGVNEKQCAFIAKEGDNGECYTVHDDSIRQYLKDQCLSTSDVESNGVISVATMRSVLTCTSLSIPSIATDRGISLNSITTLQGLEYATSLTSLTLDGYDLSGDINSNAEYDKLVVQILAKAVTSGTIDSGLRILSASGCGLSAISDVLDLTPIANGDSTTDQFKLTSLDLSNNSISDVSVLITSSMFPDDTDAVLTTLDISDNNICDIEGIVSQLQTEFPTLSTLTYSDQTCHCSASVSSSDHQVCREVYPDQWAVECWNGYYLDKASGECLEVCTSGSELDTSIGTPPYSCTTATSDVNDSIRLQVCERHSNMMPVLEEGASSITCGCRSGFHGDSCEYVDIPDSNLRSAVCLAVVNPSAHDSSCDVLTLSDMATVTSVSASIVDSFEGLQSAVNLTSLSISGTSSSSVSIGNTDLGYLPLSLVELSLEAVYLDADSDFSIFPNLTTLSLKNNSSYDLTNSALFPSSSSSSSSSFTSLDVSYTALSSFSSIPTSITTLTANNCSSLTSFSTISNLTNLVS
ncbi:hypothetical protein ADUPG1_006129, partial [Aduncisulcus paluster]